jgi:hypothetical protein
MVLSEKTLEINFVRNFKHSQHFIWQGATLREEAHGGWDVKLDGLRFGRSFILQFKRPYAVKTTQNNCKTFIFYINNNTNGDQNQLLSNLAQSLGPTNVFYALPCVENLSQLASPREAILWKTALIDIHQVNLTNLSRGKHKIEITCCNGSIPNNGFVYSEPKEIQIMTVQEYKEWGFNLERLREFNRQNMIDIRSNKFSVKFFTEI